MQHDGLSAGRCRWVDPHAELVDLLAQLPLGKASAFVVAVGVAVGELRQPRRDVCVWRQAGRRRRCVVGEPSVRRADRHRSGWAVRDAYLHVEVALDRPDATRVGGTRTHGSGVVDIGPTATGRGQKSAHRLAECYLATNDCRPSQPKPATVALEEGSIDRPVRFQVQDEQHTLRKSGPPVTEAQLAATGAATRSM